MFGKLDKALAELVRSQVAASVKEAIADTTTALGKIRKVAELQKEIETLKIQKSTMEWENEKKLLEVEHKVGLEKTRQEQELELGKRDATVTVREENLEADKARFDEHMEFLEVRFTKEVDYLKEIVGQVLSCVQGIERGNGGDDRDK